jgi:hypothetical protein
MTTASLSNMSVRAGGINQILLMPKLAFRYSVTFIGFGNGVQGAGKGDPLNITKQLIKFDRPKVSFKPIELPIYNSTVKIAGKHEWADITCEIRDSADGGVSRIVGSQLQSQLDFQEQSSAAAGNNYKFTANLDILDGSNGADITPDNGGILERWEITGCYLKEVNYNSQAMDYSASEPLKIAMTISYDNAYQLIGGTVGTSNRRHVGGTLSTSATPLI